MFKVRGMTKFGDMMMVAASLVPGANVPPFPQSAEAKNECSQMYKAHVIIKHM